MVVVVVVDLINTHARVGLPFHQPFDVPLCRDFRNILNLNKLLSSDAL